MECISRTKDEINVFNRARKFFHSTFYDSYFTGKLIEKLYVKIKDKNIKSKKNNEENEKKEDN